MDDGTTKEENIQLKAAVKELNKIICDIMGLNPKDLKTRIDVYSRDSSGKNIIIGRKLYSAEDLMVGTESGILYDAIVRAIIKECNIPYRDMIHFAYPDHETMDLNTLCIEITNYIEQKDDDKRG